MNMKWWMIVTVEAGIAWPTEETSIDFMGHQLFLRPPTSDQAADVRIQYKHPSDEYQAFETVLRFLSTLSWSRRSPARARLRIACTYPMRGGKGNNDPCLCAGFSPSNLQLPTDPKACLAIALYREARSIRNTPYEFLGYFKIINICYRTGQEQTKWINETIPLLTDDKAKQRIKQLKSQEEDISAYLYQSGRCAVAHASVDPVVDPDNPNDFLRLSADMPVARALAEYLMENELGLS